MPLLPTTPDMRESPATSWSSWLPSSRVFLVAEGCAVILTVLTGIGFLWLRAPQRLQLNGRGSLNVRIGHVSWLPGCSECDTTDARRRRVSRESELQESWLHRAQKSAPVSRKQETGRGRARQSWSGPSRAPLPTLLEELSHAFLKRAKPRLQISEGTYQHGRMPCSNTKGIRSCRLGNRCTHQSLPTDFLTSHVLLERRSLFRDL